MNLKEKIRFWFDDLTTPIGRATDICILFLIAVACVSAVADTYDLNPGSRLLLRFVDHVITVLFIIEYLLRRWVAENRTKHVFTLYSIIDLLAIMPGVFFARKDHFAVLRIFRVFRMLRLIRFLESERFFFGTITQLHLHVMRVTFTLICIPFVSAGLIFYAEQYNGSQFGNFFDAFYYSVVTLTTVGFGDIVPVTTQGRIVTVLMITAGIVFIPWQVKNLVAYVVTTRAKVRFRCQSCGTDYHESDAQFCRCCGAEISIRSEEG